MGQQTGIVETRVELPSSDGRPLPAFVAEPGPPGSAPGVVIAPEIFGVSKWIENVARGLAHEGFRAIAPEIFTRDAEPSGSDMQTMMARMRRLDIAQAVRDLRTALESLGARNQAVIGFCMGGALSILTAAEGGVAACVDCYGRPRWGHTQSAPHAIDAAPRVRCAVLGIYGKRDQGIPVAQAEELRAALPEGSEFNFYEAGHAFLNDTRPDMYVEEQATLAWSKILGFLRRHLT
jgi:carboxymethylenebutenolidase